MRQTLYTEFPSILARANLRFAKTVYRTRARSGYGMNVPIFPGHAAGHTERRNHAGGREKCVLGDPISALEINERGGP